jgi:predicted DNA-binding protein YlxM (UPF0122 family)
MNISNLEAFVDNLNRMGAIFGSRPVSLLNPKDRQRIAEHIDMQLSPENLACDGEISRAQIQKKYNYLTRCAQELLSIDPAVTFYEYN